MLVMVIVLEEFQIKPVVSLLFFFWNIVELLRYSVCICFYSSSIGKKTALLSYIILNKEYLEHETHTQSHCHIPSIFQNKPATVNQIH